MNVSRVSNLQKACLMLFKGWEEGRVIKQLVRQGGENPALLHLRPHMPESRNGIVGRRPIRAPNCHFAEPECMMFGCSWCQLGYPKTGTLSDEGSSVRTHRRICHADPTKQICEQAVEVFSQIEDSAGRRRPLWGNLHRFYVIHHNSHSHTHALTFTVACAVTVTCRGRCTRWHMRVFIGTVTFTRLLRHSHVPVRQVQEQLAEIVNVLPQEEQVVEQIVGTFFS